jgi:TetR/AcrR family transcriptional regulator, transcriptional repressor for nem operon
MKRTNSSVTSSAPPERGRPREFDIEEVTEIAGRVFWEQGYHATSIESLCTSTGLFRASLYSTFGDKHGLLVAAFDQYAEGAIARLRERLHANLTAREALRGALLHYTQIAAKLSGRHGCLITNAAIELLPADEVLRPHIETTLRRISSHLAAAVVRGQQTGEFNQDLDEQEIANFLLCLIQGMRVLGKVNVSQKELISIVDIGMRALL